MEHAQLAQEAPRVTLKSGSTTPTSKSSNSSRSHSPILLISRSLRSSPVRLEGGDVELEIDLPVLGCQTPASAAPRHAPSPIAWSAGGWHPGAFSFGLCTTGLASHQEEEGEADVDGAEFAQLEHTSSVEFSRLSLSPDYSPMPNSDQINSSISTFQPSPDSTSVVGSISKVKLTPTAAPFEFKPNPDAAAFVPPSSSAIHQTAPAFNTGPSPVPFPASLNGYPADIGHRFDEHGQLVSPEAAYSIADEILALQSPVARPLGISRAQTYSGAAIDHAAQQLGHRQQASWQGSLGQSGGAGLGPPVFPPTGPVPVYGPEYLRSRSASLGSSYIGTYSSSPKPIIDHVGYQSGPTPQELQKLAADQLQSYFGPSTVGVNPPLGTYPPPPSTVYEPAQSIYGTTPAGPLIADVSPTSPLYIAARETFVAHAVARFDPVLAGTMSPAMGAHFDSAMNALHPLAELYSISTERADQLAASPSSSGIDELVLRVAARRGGYRPALGDVGGPSPSNKKAALWKTELCRSWEEKGSCRYGVKCQFAHSAAELRPVTRHSKFKTEACRSFMTTGVCPYGARCVFRHTTEQQTTPPSGQQHGRSHSSSTSAQAMNEDPSLIKSRLGLRTSTTSVPAAGFGPALASYLGPSAATNSIGSTPTNSHPPSPIQERFTPFESSFPSSVQMAPSQEARRLSTSVEVPSGQVPPQFAEAPQSRLQRLSTQRGMSRSGSVSSGTTIGAGGSLRTRSSFESASALQQFAINAQHRNGNGLSSHAMTRQPSFTNPFAPIPGTTVGGSMVQQSHSSAAAATTPRHGSTSSFGSFVSSSGYASSFLPRKSSSSSLSSFNSSRDHAGPLKPAGAEWFAAGGNMSRSSQGVASGSSLDWPGEYEAVAREPTPSSNPNLFIGQDPLLG